VVPKSIDLWLYAVDCEIANQDFQKASQLLNSARSQVDRHQVDLLWLKWIEVEEMSGGDSRALVAAATEECPFSGRLWARAIESEPRAGQNQMGVTALKKCENDACDRHGREAVLA